MARRARREDSGKGAGGPGRARRAIAAVAKAAGLGVVFAAAAAAGAIVHLRLPAPRRFVTARVNTVLGGMFKGRITVLHVGFVGLDRIGGVDAEVFDPEGERVLVLRGVRARFGTLSLLRSLVSGDRLVVRIPELAVDGAEAMLEQNAAGEIGLQRAFESRAPSTAPSRGAEVSVPRIRLVHAWIHGHLAAAPVVDADLEDFAGAFASTPDATTIEVERSLVRARGLGARSPEGAVAARATLPSEAKGVRRVFARYEGRVGEIPLRAEGSLAGEHVDAVVDVPEAGPAAIAALAPGRIHLGAPVSAHAEVHGELPVLKPELRARIGGSEITASATVTLPLGTRTELVAFADAGAKDLDLSLLQEGAPRSRLTAAIEAQVIARSGGEVSGTFHLENQVGRVSGQVVPAASVRGLFTERSVRGSAQIAERGAPTTVQFSLQPRPGGASPDQLGVKVDTTVPDLGAVARIGRVGSGRAHLVAEGSVDLGTKHVDANASVEVAGIAVKGVELARGVVTGSAEGALESPRLAAKFLGAGLRAGGYGWTSVHASVSGVPQALDLNAGVQGDSRSPTVTARARVTSLGGGTHLRGEALATLGEVGRLEISAIDVALRGPATQPAAWKTATGSVAIDGVADLDRLMAQLPPESRPVESASGVITLRGTAARPSLSASPALELEASTSGLAVVAKQAKQRNPDGSVTLGPEPWRTKGLDASIAVQLAGSTGRARVSAKLHDEHGPLASIEANANLPIAEISQDPRRLLALLPDTPIEASLAVPRRSLDAMPPALGRLPVEGDVELTARFRGTARAPELTLAATGTNLLPRGAAACVRPMNVEADVAYDGAKAGVRLAASRDGRRVMGADATVKVSAAQVLAGGALAWEASGDVALTRFPLETASSLLARPIAGNVSGRVAVRDLHRAASLDAQLDLRDLTLDRATFPRGKVRVTMKDGALEATARLDQADGYAATTATGAMAWGAELAPRLDLERPVEVAIHARNFRADAAMPFVQGIFSELDGRIDTDSRVRIERGGKDGQMEGAVVLRDGTFEVPQIGGRFHALRGRIIMKPWGTLRFDDFYAEAPTGRLTAKARAVLAGLSLRSATAEVRVAKGESIPITVEGVPMGRAYGEVRTVARMSKDGKRLDVEVDVPALHVDLPQSTGHAVQPLEPDKTVRVGVHAGGEFVSIPLGPPQKPRAPSDIVIRAAVKLGEVEARRDTTVDLVATGQLSLEVRDRTRVNGRIDLERGKLELQGKLFTLDHGVVSFVNDPANPLILATTYWDAPDGTRVYADFSGYVTSGKLGLRSDPPLSQDEILSLILFGSPDGSFGAEAPPGREESTGVKAAGIAGGIVTQGLNKAISGITTADITTRVDTSKADNPRPELAVQISKSVSARLGYKLGVPAPGENPDRTELTLDWRFIRNWSLVAVVGDQGSTSLDVVWRLRY